MAMQMSSQYARIMPSCGEMVFAMYRRMGSSASAKSVMERGQPCFTPDVKRILRDKTPLKKIVCKLCWYNR